jgi:hypothetical protein
VTGLACPPGGLVVASRAVVALLVVEALGVVLVLHGELHLLVQMVLLVLVQEPGSTMLLHF